MVVDNKLIESTSCASVHATNPYETTLILHLNIIILGSKEKILKKKRHTTETRMQRWASSVNTNKDHINNEDIWRKPTVNQCQPYSDKNGCDGKATS